PEPPANREDPFQSVSEPCPAPCARPHSRRVSWVISGEIAPSPLIAIRVLECSRGHNPFCTRNTKTTPSGGRGREARGGQNRPRRRERNSVRLNGLRSVRGRTGGSPATGM